MNRKYYLSDVIEMISKGEDITPKNAVESLRLKEYLYILEGKWLEDRKKEGKFKLEKQHEI